MLTQYRQTVQRLLKDEKQERFNLFDLTDWINVARGQVAGEGEATRALVLFTTTPAMNFYNFSGISLAAVAGAASVLSVRMITGGGALLTPREWEWFNSYYIPAPTSGAPRDWCQYGQGAQGSFLLNPVPNAATALHLDLVFLPIPLVDDATVEAIPYPWTDAVPYYAAYQAYLTAQDSGNAKNMLDLYEIFMRRARTLATPTVLPLQYEMGHSALSAPAAASQQAA